MDWSGLHLEMTLPKDTMPPGKDDRAGLMCVVNNNWEWPSYGKFNSGCNKRTYTFLFV